MKRQERRRVCRLFSYKYPPDYYRGEGHHEDRYERTLPAKHLGPGELRSPYGREMPDVRDPPGHAGRVHSIRAAEYSGKEVLLVTHDERVEPGYEKKIQAR